MMEHADQIEFLAQSGWNTCPSVREGVLRAGLPLPAAQYLRQTFSPSHWKKVGNAIDALKDHFSHGRFGERAVFGDLLVPDPAKLDTRGAVDPELPAGKLMVQPGTDWTLVATITGPEGVHQFARHVPKLLQPHFSLLVREQTS
ncbi:MAG: hypothetical protein ACYCTV_10255 [Leptospirales bacterium]